MCIRQEGDRIILNIDFSNSGEKHWISLTTEIQINDSIFEFKALFKIALITKCFFRIRQYIV